jgi:chromatin remodeling complex protein RSC6
MARDLYVSPNSTQGDVPKRISEAAKLARVDLSKVTAAAPAAAPAPKKPAAKSKAKPRASKLARTTRHSVPDFMQPRQPDAALSAVVGDKPLPRTEVTKKLWSYIKKQGLQDKRERRMIHADAKLKPVFGGKQKVSMFEMTKLINKHLKPVKAGKGAR